MTRTQQHSVWNALRADISAHRRRRDARKALEHDVATYTSPADRLELDILIESNADADTVDLRRAVARTRAA